METHPTRALLVILAASLFCALSWLGSAVDAASCACGETAGGTGRCGCEACHCDRCCLVPEVRTEKKWVYAVKLVPYCLTKCPNPLKCRHDACDSCPTCEECVRYKRVLIKREVATKKTVCKCVPGCQACQAQAAAAAATPQRAVAAPSEPLALPAPAGPEPAASP